MNRPMQYQTADGRPPMTAKAMQLETLKTTIQRDEYSVDPDKVAEAIVALLVRRQNSCS